jgi:hypothetical protein
LKEGWEEMPIKIAGITLYELKEISEKLKGKVTSRTLRNYIKQRKLRAKKVAGRWYVSDVALREYFNVGESQKRRKK